MQLTHILNGCLDAKDFRGAALAVVNHPLAERFDRKTIDRLFSIGALGTEPDKVDQAFISLVGDMVSIAEELTA